MSDFGVASMTAELRRVAVRPPSSRGDYAAAHWAQPVDLALLVEQHAAFVELLRRLGCEEFVDPLAAGLPAWRWPISWHPGVGEWLLERTLSFTLPARQH